MVKTVVGIFIVFAAIGFSTGDPNDKKEVHKLLDEGIKLYEEGKFEEAYKKFESALQKQPGYEVIAAWIDRVDTALIFQMQNADTGNKEIDQKVRDLGRRLFELSKPSVTFPKTTQKEVAYYMNNLDASQTDVWRNSFYHLVNFGPYAVKYLVPVLGDSSRDQLRVRSILVLSRIGQAATFALCQALKSGNSFLRQNSCHVLGNIKDRRAVSYLKRVLEDPSELPEVKSVAMEALVNILGSSTAIDKISASSSLYEYASGYFFQDPEVLPVWERYYLVWSWDTDKDRITEREVPGFAYNEQMAEEILYDLITWYPEYERAYPLFVLALLSQQVEADEILTRGQIGTQAKYIPSGLFKQLQEKLSATKYTPVLAALTHRNNIYKALDIAVSSKNPQLAVACIRILGNIAVPTDFPLTEDEAGAKIGTPLVNALRYDNNAYIRYNSAIELSRIVPHLKVLNSDLIIKNLSDAIHETGIRTILVIYEIKTRADFDNINRLKNEIIQANAYPIVASTLEEGIYRAKDHTVDDAIFIQYKLAARAYISDLPDIGEEQATVSLFDSLRDDVRTKNVPKILLYDSEREKEDSVIFSEHIAGMLSTQSDKFTIQKKLTEIFADEEIVKDQKKKADIMASMAAEALAELNVYTTVLDYTSSVKEIISILDSNVIRPNIVRIPLIRALGNFIDQNSREYLQKSISVLIKLIKEGQSGEAADPSLAEVKFEASRALARIASKNSPELGSSDLNDLVSFLFDSDIRVQKAVSEMLGNSMLTNEQRVQIMQKRRLQRTASEE